MRRLKKLLIGRYSVAILLVMAVALAGVLLGVGAPKVSANACNIGNDIIDCGFSGNQNFINTIKNNDGGKHSDLANVYNFYGLSQADYSHFVTSAQPGLVYKNGNLVVNGKVIATGVNSIGRSAGAQGSGYFTVKISGKNYYGNSNDKTFLSSPLNATVLMDSSGHAQFAVINSCGNPIGVPYASCNQLNASKVAGTDSTYKFSANVTADSTAKISKVVYNFGDGSSDTETDPTVVVTHKYAKSATYKATLTVYVSIAGATAKPIAVGNCQKVITVTLPQPPVYTCDALAFTPIDNSLSDYSFRVTTTAKYGAVVHSATFNFGDKSATKTVLAATDGTITTSHAYDSATKATYTAYATLLVYLPGGKHDTVGKTTICTRSVPVNVAAYSCNSLSGSLLDEATHKYSFTAVASYNSLVTFKNAQFDFGDSSPVVTVPKGSDGKTETATHAYTVLGNYTVVVTLNFQLNNDKKVVTAKCTTAVSPTGVTGCQAGATTSSTGALCSPCATNSAIPSNSSQCTLPNTGAGDVIGVAGVAAVLGFFLYRQFIYRKHIAHTPDGVAVAGGPPVAEHDGSNDVTAAVIAHHTSHPNKQGLHHASYHKPHRFRPRSHHDEE